MNRKMLRGALMEKVATTYKKKPEDVQSFQIGDEVEVHQWILEGVDKEGKEKKRVQVFGGTVIAKRGAGLQEAFTVRRLVQQEGVERTFPLHSPKIAKIVVKRSGVVRRAKLYYLRDRVGKATRLRERKAKPTTAVATGTPKA
jgi:large subunit ribosomal protein L19